MTNVLAYINKNIFPANKPTVTIPAYTKDPNTPKPELSKLSDSSI